MIENLIEDLKIKDEKLNNLSYYLESISFMSVMLILVSLVLIIASFPIANYKKNPLKVSTVAFLSSSTLFFASKFMKNKIEKNIEINSKEIEKAKSRNKKCYGCVYYNENVFLLCAVHPLNQPENCFDKITN